MDESYHDAHATLSSKFPALAEQLLLHGKTIADILLADDATLSKQINWSVREIEDYRRVLNGLLTSKPVDVRETVSGDVGGCISTGLPQLDADLGGGIPRGDITEIFGESGSGKSHLMLSIAVNSVLKGDEKCAYICTEKFLETKRLQAMADHFQVNVDNISYIYCANLEAQDHIFTTQLPILLASGDYSAVVIDSISHHWRLDQPFTTNSCLDDKISTLEAQLDEDELAQVASTPTKPKFAFMTAAYERRITKQFLANDTVRQLMKLATEHNVAIVVGNQVADNVNKPVDASQFQGADDPFNYDFISGVASGWTPATLQQFNHVPVDVSIDIHAMDPYRRMVSALGPSWLRWSANRVLVKKSYHVAKTDDELEEEASTVWNVKRSAVVVSSKGICDNTVDPVPFTITATGLAATTATA
ncbi:hypothetical protein DIURU_002257 [Diutina rugosa]|uniref:RecA family profile 1 domain-containing protein n=1 Tax=Diutina rugosa TaxID=5481 RepID=A0A642UVK2_DIURU|nr:uncharacterized protein DIURU_002257 [Diutina rugosa]KAA8903745.1 hypothetical protein DIURU_002257 [Diutina rugosa]